MTPLGMTSRFSRILELGANAAVILASAALIAVALRHWDPPGNRGGPPPWLRPGDSLANSKVPLKPGRANLLFVLQAGCRFCTSSAPALREIAQMASRRGDVDILAILPQDAKTSQEYLEGLGLRLPVLQASPHDLRVRGTPTVILSDGSGRVLSVWAGALDENRGAEVSKSVAQIGGSK